MSVRTNMSFPSPYHSEAVSVVCRRGHGRAPTHVDHATATNSHTLMQHTMDGSDNGVEVGGRAGVGVGPYAPILPSSLTTETQSRAVGAGVGTGAYPSTPTTPRPPTPTPLCNTPWTVPTTVWRLVGVPWSGKVGAHQYVLPVPVPLGGGECLCRRGHGRAPTFPDHGTATTPRTRVRDAMERVDDGVGAGGRAGVGVGPYAPILPSPLTTPSLVRWVPAWARARTHPRRPRRGHHSPHPCP